MRIYLTEVLANRRFDLIPEVAAEDMVDHTQTIGGRAGLDNHARGFCDNIPDLEVDVELIFASENEVVGIWRWNGTPTAAVHGRSRKGNPIEPRRVASIFRLKDGMLADYEVFLDAVDVLQQIGAPIEFPVREESRP